MSIVTRKFEPLAREEAKYMGGASLPILVIPHPLEGLPRVEIEELVAAQLDFLEQSLMRTTAAPDQDVARPGGTRLVTRLSSASSEAGDKPPRYSSAESRTGSRTESRSGSDRRPNG